MPTAGLWVTLAPLSTARNARGETCRTLSRLGALTSVVGRDVMGALVPPGLVALSLTREICTWPSFRDMRWSARRMDPKHWIPLLGLLLERSPRSAEWMSEMARTTA